MAGGLLMGKTNFAQVNYTNLEWVDQTPVVGDTYFHTSSMVSGGQLYVTSNVMNEGGHTDILLIKYGEGGDTTWSSTFNGSANGDDYGIELTTYAGNYIYVTGAVENTSSGYDYAVLKIDASNGDLEWSYTFDGPQGGTDIPSDIVVDENDLVYVCGAIEDAYGYSDFGVIRIDDSGNFDWSMAYDDNQLWDGATALTLMENNELGVTGGSNYEAGVWNVTVLELDRDDGSIISEVQSTSTSVAFLEVTAMTTDADNNLYLTGYTQGSDKDVHTVKFDSTLTVEWVVDYDGGNDDEGNDIEVDSQGNIYVVGYTERDSGGYNYLTIKYESDGNEDWVRELGNATPNTEYATAEKLDLDNQANIYLTGTVEQGSESGMSFVMYDTDGNIKLYRKYETQSVSDRAYDIDFYGNAVYITGLSHSTATGTLTVLKYELAERDMTVVQESGVDSYVADELIVSINPDSMITSTVNDKDKIFGELDEFVTAGVISDLSTVYPSINWNRVRTYKIHKRLTTNDTTTITRTGYEMEMPKFWAHLLISIPNEDELAVLDSLDNSSIHLSVNGVELNDLFSLAADPLYTTNQWSMYESTTYPDADIGTDGAWNYETGKDHIKVGVFDTGIMYSHQDLGGSIDPNGKIKDGWDYTAGSGMPITSVPNNGDENGHGTKVAGVIGALKDNETGIAGIAGGYWPYAPGEVIQGDPDPLENRGVSLYALKVGYSSGYIDGSVVEEALTEGASNSTTGYGYGLDILNCSFVKNIDAFDDSVWNAMSEAQEYVFRNGAVLVAAKGNNGQNSYATPAYAWREYWVVAVGGSDTLGNYHSSANYGNQMDLVAPYSSQLAYTTDNDANNDYGSFSGTSSATAHVSGVAALMMSYINDETPSAANLFPDDVEYLIKHYANDIDELPADFGYDDLTGYGLLNADSTMEYLDTTQYLIRHYFTEFVFDSSNWASQDGFTVKYKDGNIYKVRAYYMTDGVNHTLNPGDVILNSWPLNSYCNTAFIGSTFGQAQCTYIMDLTNVTNTSANCVGHTFRFEKDANGNPLANPFWWPIAPNDMVKMGYTLHLETAYAGIDEQEKEFGFSCFPNPSESMLTVQFELLEQSKVAVEVFDLQGRLVQTIALKNHPAGQQNINLNVKSLSNGVYTVRLRINNTYYNEKFIKK